MLVPFSPAFALPICDNRNPNKDECWIARSQHSSEHKTSRTEWFGGGCTKRGCDCHELLCVAHARTAPRAGGGSKEYVAERSGITSLGNMEWGRQLSPEAYEPRGGNGSYPGRNPCGVEDRTRAHKATIWAENCTLLRLLRKQIVESRQTVVTR